MNENYTTQVLGSSSGADSFEALFPQLDFLSEEISKSRKRKKGKGKKGKKGKKMKKQLKTLEAQQHLTQQLLAAAIWQYQAQASSFAGKSSKKKKKKKAKKKQKTPTWFEEVLVQSLPTVIATSFDRMLPPPQSQSVLALPDGRNHKQ